MKTRALPMIAMTICVSAALTLPALADSGRLQSISYQKYEAKMKHIAPNTETAASPTTVMTQIHELVAKLATTVGEKKLEDVHHLAFAIRDLVATLPPTFQADKQAKVAATARNIDSIASALDESGDAKDQLKTEANLKKLHGLVKMLESQVSNP